MYIEEITIEGFKSFSRSVTIQKLDPQFNAITGPNGTGKSNILDAICFVLGMKSLAQMRVGNLQEVICSQGTSGITKATVSITFDNNEPEKAPMMYRDDKKIIVSRQVQVGGYDKYWINGKVQQQKNVRDFFCSMQLNVNNPHFLIMQGSISKVLRMSPKEILGLLSEAAGTSMYEQKRNETYNMIQKKETDLNQIDQLMQEELEPRVQRLLEERDQFLRWQEADKNHKQLQQYVQAYEYYCLQRNIRQSLEAQQQVQKELQGFEGQAVELDQVIQQCKRQQKEIMDQMEAQHGPEIKRLRLSADQLMKRISKEESDLVNQQEILAQEQANQQELEEKFLQASDEVLQPRLVERQNQAQIAVNSYEESSKTLEQMKSELQGLEDFQGVPGTDINRTMKERTINVKNQKAAVENEIQHLQRKIANESQTTGNVPMDEQELVSLRNQMAVQQQTVQQLEAQLKETGFDNEQMRGMIQQKGDLQRQIQKLRSHREQVRQTLSDLNNGVTHAEYRGTVAELIRVKKQDCVVAINVAAGGSLYSAVIEREITAKELIQSNTLKKRVNFFCMDTVKGRKISDAKLRQVRQVAGEKAWLALDLIEYEPRFEEVMKFVFGSVFICQDNVTAARLSRDDGGIACTCVTLDGTLYQPGGMLVGGTRKQESILLLQLETFREIEEQCRRTQHEFNQVCNQIGEMERRSVDQQRINQELGNAQASLTQIQDQVRSIEEEFANYNGRKQKIQELQQSLQEKQNNLQELKQQEKELQYQCANFEKERANIVKDLKKRIKMQEKAVQEKQKASQEAQMLLTEVTTEIEVVVNERPALEQSLQEVKIRVSDISRGLMNLETSIRQVREQHEQVTRQLEAKREQQKGQDQQVKELDDQVDELRNQKTDIQEQIANQRRKLTTSNNEQKQAKAQCQQMEKEFRFISKNKHQFGVQGGNYDWESRNPDQVRAQLQECNKVLATIGRNVNKDAMLQVDEKEKELVELTKKRRVLQQDKDKILEVMGELDERKRITLQQVWQKVNSDMDKIFNSLLPNTRATLETKPGQSFLEGLIIKVQFGEVHKSLEEMSGGQRSLLALSFLLALLLFKPAPLYILDEVDAALDLSHTANIGKMIKEHFPHSQFLIVSHKEGMFNNANVLFRTRFVENSTQVERTQNENAYRQSLKGSRKRGQTQQVLRMIQ